MIIELIGPSGSGKTTTVEQLDQIGDEFGNQLMGVAELRQLENAHGWRRVRKFGDRAFAREMWPLFLRYPGIVWSIVMLMVLQGKPMRTRAAKRALVLLSFSLHLRKHYPDRLIVLDEGFVQSLWGLLIGSQRLRGQSLLRRIMKSYWRAVKPVGIQFRIDPALTRERAFSRQSQGRFNRKSSADLHHQFGPAVEHHRRLVALMPKGMIQASIDVSCTKAELSTSVADAIRAIG